MPLPFTLVTAHGTRKKPTASPSWPARRSRAGRSSKSSPAWPVGGDHDDAPEDRREVHHDPADERVPEPPSLDLRGRRDGRGGDLVHRGRVRGAGAAPEVRPAQDASAAG